MLPFVYIMLLFLFPCILTAFGHMIWRFKICLRTNRIGHITNFHRHVHIPIHFLIAEMEEADRTTKIRFDSSLNTEHDNVSITILEPCTECGSNNTTDCVKVINLKHKTFDYMRANDAIFCRDCLHRGVRRDRPFQYPMYEYSHSVHMTDEDIALYSETLQKFSLLEKDNLLEKLSVSNYRPPVLETIPSEASPSTIIDSKPEPESSLPGN